MSGKYRFLPESIIAMLAGTVAAAETKAVEALPRILSFAECPSAVYKTGEIIRFKIWQKITHMFQLPDNSYRLTLQFSVTDSIDLDSLILNTEK